MYIPPCCPLNPTFYALHLTFNNSAAVGIMFSSADLIPLPFVLSCMFSTCFQVFEAQVGTSMSLLKKSMPNLHFK